MRFIIYMCVDDECFFLSGICWFETADCHLYPVQDLKVGNREIVGLLLDIICTDFRGLQDIPYKSKL